MDDPLVVWPVRLALVGLFACWALLILRREAAARWAASAGWVLMVLHYAAAFAIVYEWSHGAAAAATAADTKATTGSDFQGGIWLNYLFLLLWLIELLLWWLKLRPRWLFWLVHGFLLFMTFNATIVFETGPIRWAAVGGLLGLVAMLGLRFARPASAATETET